MAGTNKFIEYGTTTSNTFTDDQLNDALVVDKSGIAVNSIAFSNILNALMRQLTSTNKAFGDLVALNLTAGNNVDSSTISSTVIKTTIENIAKEVSNINEAGSSLLPNGIKFWVGTEAQYNLVDPKNLNVLYIIT